MDRETHALLLGKVVSNLHGLEVALRAAIGRLAPESQRESWRLTELSVGRRLLANAFTNYDALSALLRKFNGLVAPEERIDSAPLVALRDAIAHGRALSEVPGFPLTLVKFSRPDDQGNVLVEYYATMTEEWFASSIRLVYSAVDNISRFAR